MNGSILRKAILIGILSSTFGVASIALSTTSASASPVITAAPATLPKFGDNGPEVVRLQEAIMARGFTIKGGVTGSYSEATRSALKSLQKVAGFKASGTLDAKTAKFLGLVDVVALSSSSLPAVGASGDAVWSVQQALINSGFTVKGGADGKFGLATTIALGKFQTAKGLKVTKVVDESTAIALGMLSAPKPVVVASVKTVTAPAAPVAAPAAPVATPAAPDAAATTMSFETLPARGQSGELVRALQNALIANGTEVKGGADGVFGVATTVAISNFQAARALNQTKVLDVNTAVALALIPSFESLGLPTLQVFPMQGGCGFSDTWHQPRSGGRLHEGVDIMGAKGLAIYATNDGVISRMSTGGALGGNAIYVKIPNGTYFYYAHLDSFAPGIAAGVPVKAGQVIGYNGSTGSGGSTHLHFEVHPFGGPAVSPYQFVKAVDACNVTTVLPQP
jgi:murein DD-endopeptidase MepM/ murein hydrolase activator NlpD